MLQRGFEGAVKQVGEAKLFPLDFDPDLLDIDRVWSEPPKSERRGLL